MRALQIIQECLHRLLQTGVQFKDDTEQNCSKTVRQKLCVHFSYKYVSEGTRGALIRFGQVSQTLLSPSWLLNTCQCFAEKTILMF